MDFRFVLVLIDLILKSTMGMVFQNLTMYQGFFKVLQWKNKVMANAHYLIADLRYSIRFINSIEIQWNTFNLTEAFFTYIFKKFSNKTKLLKLKLNSIKWIFQIFVNWMNILFVFMF